MEHTMKDAIVEDYAPNNKSKSRKPKWVSEVKKMISEMELCKEVVETPQHAANERQVGGDHYKQMSLQPWDVCEKWMTKAQFIGYLFGTALAYLGRFNVEDAIGKGGVKDIEKCEHCLQKLIEVINSENP